MKNKKLSIDYLLRTFGVGNEIEKAKELIDRNELLELISKICQIINDKKRNENQLIKNGGFIQIGGLTATVLAKFNEKIRSVGDNEEKEELEMVLSCIALEFIEFCVTHLKSSKQQISLQILEALFDCSDLYGYKVEDLFRFLKLDQFLSFHKSIQENDEPVIDPSKGLPKFQWKGSKENLMHFIEILSTYNISKDVVKWQKLFSIKVNEVLDIELNEDNPDTVYLFFQVADSMSLFSPQNTNGFYKVLQYHCVNFNTVFLKSLTPRERNRRLKARKDWESLYTFWSDVLKSTK